MENNQEVDLTIIFGNMKFKFQFYTLNEKIRNAQENGFRFDELMNLTITIGSSQININIHYYLKLPIPIMQRDSFKNITRTRICKKCLYW